MIIITLILNAIINIFLDKIKKKDKNSPETQEVASQDAPTSSNNDEKEETEKIETPDGISEERIDCGGYAVYFCVPSGFTDAEDGMYYAPEYPNDTANVNITTSDNDRITFEYTKDAFCESVEQLYEDTYGYDVDVNCTKFEQSNIDGHRTLLITASYELLEMEIEQVQFAIETQRGEVTTITYTQEKNGKWSDLFSQCIQSIRIEKTEGVETQENVEMDEESYKNQCVEYSYEDIARNPDSVKGQYAKFTGEVIQVVESGRNVVLRVNVTNEGYGYYSDTIYVEYTRKSENEDRTLEGDIITIYGQLGGLETYTSIFGQEISIPKVFAEYIENGESSTGSNESVETEREEKIVYQDENVIITFTGITGEENDYLINFIVENLSSKTLIIQQREMSINGFMVDPICSIEVAPGKKAIDDAEIWSDDAENCPMSSVENIETKFYIFNSYDWNDRYDTDNVIILG